MNVASGLGAGIGSGTSNDSTGIDSWVGGGLDNKASGDYSVVPGGQDGVAPYRGSRAFSSRKFSIQGDNQELVTELNASTTDATPTTLQLADGTAGITIPTDCTANVYIRAVAVQTGGAAGTIGDSFMQNIKLCVKNIAGASSVVAMNAVTLANYSTVAGNILYELSACDAAFAGTIAVTVAANKIQVTVTGELNKNINWKSMISMDWIGYRNFTV